jgi:hypothetical protein
MARKRAESAIPKTNPGSANGHALGERSPGALSREDVIEIAAENAKLRRALDRVVDAVSNEDLDGAAEELEAAGYRVDFSQDD